MRNKENIEGVHGHNKDRKKQSKPADFLEN